MKKIAVATSGGDGPGMNAAIRSVVRHGIAAGAEVVGVIAGFQGLIDDEIIDLNHRSVSNIIGRGGTILKTDRCEEFKTDAGQHRAHDVLQKHGIEGLIVIGGDGSYRGLNALHEKFNFPTIGVPGTIDNDIYGTDETIGCHTAVNTALDAIDKIRDTGHSMERIFVIEVMGNKSGYIAMQVALAGGVEEVIIPECEFSFDQMCKEIAVGNKLGKKSWMVVVAEGAGKANDLADRITKNTGLETRALVLGHVQRGGVPCGDDRILATRLGAAAVDCLLNGEKGLALGVNSQFITKVPLKQAFENIRSCPIELYKLLKTLT